MFTQPWVYESLEEAPSKAYCGDSDKNEDRDENPEHEMSLRLIRAVNARNRALPTQSGRGSNEGGHMVHSSRLNSSMPTLACGGGSCPRSWPRHNDNCRTGLGILPVVVEVQAPTDTAVLGSSVEALGRGEVEIGQQTHESLIDRHHRRRCWDTGGPPRRRARRHECRRHRFIRAGGGGHGLFYGDETRGVWRARTGNLAPSRSCVKRS